ncbi:protocatechuate 3,4-dioxygenase subunit alpha [Salinarimonas chemoclinalis]|uniref:protocatechuate 3,4-dioxygenase subunit alpha n=1 Tax=Salinarimonas chemoclinalis TaxID=3241599 RepID=UPI003558D79A
MTERGVVPPGITPSQTVGPFFAYCLTPEEYDARGIAGHAVASPDAAGVRIHVEGRVLDGAGEPVPDAMLEIWQADGEGRYPGDAANAAFRGFGRAQTDADGRFVFVTVKPGAVPAPGGGMQAPHIAVSVFARGLLNRLATRIYFDDEPANAADPVLSLVPPERRGTLIARRAADGVYAFDVRLQGDGDGAGETVFFEI